MSGERGTKKMTGDERDDKRLSAFFNYVANGGNDVALLRAECDYALGVLAHEISENQKLRAQLLTLATEEREAIGRDLFRKRAQLREYIAGIDPTTGECKRHALTFAEGRLAQLEMDIQAIRSRTTDELGDRASRGEER